LLFQAAWCKARSLPQRAQQTLRIPKLFNQRGSPHRPDLPSN
jgi:hypothetical protein